MSVLSRLGVYMSTKDGFMRASMVGFGVPAAVLGSWVFKNYDEHAYLFVVPCAFVAAYLWGLMMWKVMFRDLYARKRAAAPGGAIASQSESESSQPSGPIRD